MIYLASRSPRRIQLLQQIGISFETISLDVDESWDGIELAKNYVSRLSLGKALAGLNTAANMNNAVVIGADTAVVLDHSILGKAEDSAEAIHMLQLLSGRTHHVYSAVSVVSNKQSATLVNMSRVCFKPLTHDEIRIYSESGEPLGKAGGYAIQGKAAAFIERLEGSYSGVMGLPLYETSRLLEGLS